MNGVFFVEQFNDAAAVQVSVRVVGGGHVDVMRHAAQQTIVNCPGGSRTDNRNGEVSIVVYCEKGQRALVMIPESAKLEGVTYSSDASTDGGSSVLILVGLSLFALVALIVAFV
ncbi:MAG: hypothetical protein PVI21_04250 [Candidatus Woesebacteria bacterium]|jgi:hypothetical protein